MTFPRLTIAIATALFLLSACATNSPQPPTPTQASNPEPTSAPSTTAPGPAQSTPPADTQATAACLEAMEAAASEPDPDRAEPLIIATLSKCTSAEDWLVGLREHPGAMGLTSSADLGSDSLIVPCSAGPDTRVCSDATKRGLV
jgi:hypothetical protein